MSRASRGGARGIGAAGRPPAPEPLSPARRRAFLAITLVLPFVLLAGAELALRLLRPDGGLPLFVPAAVGSGDCLVANPRVGARWFSGVGAAPAPPAELFARDKPANAFRLFVLGESTTAGFPYPRNGTFSRQLADALRDVLPHDSVEVVNLGIAATNSVTMRDLAREVVGVTVDRTVTRRADRSAPPSIKEPPPLATPRRASTIPQRPRALQPLDHAVARSPAGLGRSVVVLAAVTLQPCPLKYRCVQPGSVFCRPPSPMATYSRCCATSRRARSCSSITGRSSTGRSEGWDRG